MALINLGSNLILTAGTTVATGDWYTIPGNLGNFTCQAVLTASSVGATAASTVYIEVSNTTAIAAATRATTFALSCTTDVVSDGAVFSTSMQGAWKLVRARVASLTTSTAGSAGTPSVAVYVSAGRL